MCGAFLRVQGAAGTLRHVPTRVLAPPPPRIRYDQTIADVKAAVAKKLGVPPQQQQLFWHKTELTAEYDERTLLSLDMHTGFALRGYDMVRARAVHTCVAAALAGYAAAVCACWPRLRALTTCMHACMHTHACLPQSEAPVYFPPVRSTETGLVEEGPQ